MTSINFNASATTALRTLQQTNSALETSQNRVSTGLKIGEAKDNAAYWSITTTLKSDNKALSTVKDALGLGAATVDVAYQGLSKTLEVLNEIKSKLTAATQSGVNKEAIQAEISELLNQVESIASSSSFSNENWLKASATDVKSIVASFNTSVDGTVTIGTVDFDTADAALYVGADAGIMQEKTTLANITGKAVTLGATTAAPVFDNATDTITLALTVGSANASLVINQTAVEAVGNKNATIDSKDELVSIYNNLIGASTLKDKVVASHDGTKLIFTAKGEDKVSWTAAALTSDATTTLSATNFALAASVANDQSIDKKSVAEINITSASVDTIESYIQMVNTAVKDVTSAASKLGAVASRIDLQQSFVSTLMDTIDKGVSSLIDADLSEESTRLQALQTKQQLGIQALSIANTSTQNILSLFRS